VNDIAIDVGAPMQDEQMAISDLPSSSDECVGRNEEDLGVDPKLPPRKLTSVRVFPIPQQVTETPWSLCWRLRRCSVWCASDAEAAKAYSLTSDAKFVASIGVMDLVAGGMLATSRVARRRDREGVEIRRRSRSVPASGRAVTVE